MKGDKTSRKNLARRTIAPRLSELVNETYKLLKLAHPGIKDFELLISDNEEEVIARILPLTRNEMNELYEATDNKIRYIAHTDEEHHFTGGEEK